MWANTKSGAGIQLGNFSQNKSGSAGIWRRGPVMENVWQLQQAVLLPAPRTGHFDRRGEGLSFFFF